MANTVVVVNRQYHPGDTVLTLLGIQEDEVMEINYNYKRAHTHNKSLKGLSSWSMGGISEMTCSLKLYMTAVQRIKAIAKANGVSDLTLLQPFNAAVTYANDELAEVNDIITMKFQSDGREVTGEEGLAMSYEMFVTGMQLDV